MISKVKGILAEIKDYDNEFIALSKKYGCGSLRFKLDYLVCRIMHGALLEQYFCFKMYKLNHAERNQYITAKRSMKIEKKLNTKVDFDIQNKHLFNSAYSNFVKRKWVYAPDCCGDEIISFLKDNNEIIKKPTCSYQGKSVEKISYEDVLKGDINAFVDDCIKRECVLESVIVQHGALAQLNSSSVNTIRIATLRDENNNVHILGASLRVGAPNSIVDNYHSGGVQYALDVKHGFVISGGVSSNGKTDIFYHPNSDIKMIGFQIPNWETIIESVKKAATISKTLRYLGWDIAVLEDGCGVIEANSGQGCNGMQLDGVGKYGIIKGLIK